MPFSPFVGVNHHGQSTLLGCGLVSREDTNTFVCLFRTWLACMSDCPLSDIITDQALAMKKAIEIVFPNARHRWCLWHIMNKISTKLGAYAQYKSISFAFRSLVYDSQSSTDFENGWSTFMDEYELQDNTWLSGLYDERERWVPAFVKHKFWVGMSTTQRSESMNAFFDGYVHSKTTLKQFVEQYDNALMKKVENEAQADFRSFSQQIPCVTNYDMEQKIQGFYTISKFKEFQNELIGKMYCEFTGIKEDCIVYDYEIREDVVFGEGLKKRVFFKVSFNKFESEVKCSCSKFEFKGILCRHAITVLIRNDMLLLPENYIIRRWRKNVNRCHTRVKIDYDGWNATNEQLRFDKMCTTFTKVAHLAAEDEENYNSVMEWIEKEVEKLSITKENFESMHSSLTSTHSKISENNLCIIAEGTGVILDPIAKRVMGRPPTNRMKEYVVTKRNNHKKKATEIITDNPSCYEEVGGSKTHGVKRKRQYNEKNIIPKEGIVPVEIQNCIVKRKRQYTKKNLIHKEARDHKEVEENVIVGPDTNQVHEDDLLPTN